MHYWRIRTQTPCSTNAYVKTNNQYDSKTIVYIAVRSQMFCEAFVDVIESVEEVTSEEYHKYMWD
jgi:hypothetical protein